VAVATVRECGDASLEGAALFVSSLKGQWLYVLFVRASWQRRGVATALVSGAINALYLAGERRLRSWHDFSNKAGEQWHQVSGLEEHILLLPTFAFTGLNMDFLLISYDMFLYHIYPIDKGGDAAWDYR